MDVLKSIYYIRCNKYLRFFGQWPYQKVANRVINLTLQILFSCTVVVPQCIKLFQIRHDFGLVILALPSLLYYVAYTFKIIFCAIQSNKIKIVLDKVQRDFETFEGEDIEVIHEYSAKAYKINTFYTSLVYMYAAVGAYSFLPLTLHTADTLFPLPFNQTRLQGKPRLLTFFNEKLDNSNFFIIFHGMIVDMVSIVFIIGFDTLCFALSYHTCALFNIVTYRMRDAIDKQRKAKKLDTVCKEYNNIIYQNFVETIVMHKYVLESVAIIESAFSALNLLSIGCAMLPLTLTGFQVIANKGEVDQMLRFTMFAFGEIVHLFYYNWPGQKITDHGLIVYESCYNSEWYKEAVSDKCKKLMKLMILRSQKPCYLTAGKLYILGLENFAAIVKVSMSYFTVLSSLM